MIPGDDERSSQDAVFPARVVGIDLAGVHVVRMRKDQRHRKL